MKTFKMYVKTVIYNEQEKILLLNKTENNQPSWDLPGSTFTEEQSFDETIINNVQKEIGYYVYPGKIIGISDYSDKEEKRVNVIMEGTILNGDLLLSKEYETHAWVPLDRIKDYPLTPWLKNYINSTKNPFEDVETEIEEITNRTQRRREIIQEDIKNNISSSENAEKINEEVKSSFSLLKDTIIRTFHPQKVKVTKTTPKSVYEDEKDEPETKSRFTDKFNFNFKKQEEEDAKYINEVILKDNENDIIIEHEKTEDDEEIIIEHDDIVEEIIPEKEDTIIESNDKKIFDMNINKEQNMKTDKVKKVIKKEQKPASQPEIKIIHPNEKTPHIRREKESTGKISFNSENIKRTGWKERLNRINRTEANNKKKEAPRPKGQRK